MPELRGALQKLRRTTSGAVAGITDLWNYGITETLYTFYTIKLLVVYKKKIVVRCL